MLNEFVIFDGGCHTVVVVSLTKIFEHITDFGMRAVRSDAIFCVLCLLGMRFAIVNRVIEILIINFLNFPNGRLQQHRIKQPLSAS